MVAKHLGRYKMTVQRYFLFGQMEPGIIAL